MNKNVTIRDFIYVDADRLYSLYSQVFEGVAQQIVESIRNSLTEIDTQKGPFLQGSSVEAQAVASSQRTVNKSLFDHMYNQLEKEMEEAIVNAAELSPQNYQEIFTEAFMVKVSGTAEIEDYARLNILMEKFNALADAIAYASTVEVKKAKKALWAEIQKQIENETDRNRKAVLSQQLKKDKTEFEKRIKEAIENAGLRQEEELLSNLRLMIDVFNPQGFDITMTPINGDGNVVVRGVLDKRWLRVPPDLLRGLYGSSVKSVWTMVGKVTYIPSEETLEIPLLEQGSKPETSTNLLAEATKVPSTSRKASAKAPSMRDPYHNMFQATQAFENMFLHSYKRTELLIAPLAIYHETIISKGQANSTEASTNIGKERI
jgi:hypothetical protein